MNIGQRILILLIRGYQAVISPALAVFFGPAGGCRFTPTCSHYAGEAIRLHGVVAGGALAAGRLCRCHPWGAHGADPVPLPRILPPDLNLTPNPNLSHLWRSQTAATVSFPPNHNPVKKGFGLGLRLRLRTPPQFHIAHGP
jgi:putative membrane protein insertion efficiency factor